MRLVVESLLASRPPRTRRQAGLRLLQCVPDKVGEASQRCLPVAPLAATLLCLDDDNARCADALVAAFQQTCAYRLGQGRAVPNIEPQVNGGGDFVDVLSTGSLRAHGLQIYLFHRDLHVAGDFEFFHGR